MGYDPPDATPVARLSRQLDRTARRAGAATRSSSSGTPTGSVAALQAQIDALAATVAGVPTYRAVQETDEGFALTTATDGALFEVLSVTMPAVPSKGRVVLMVSSQLSVLDGSSATSTVTVEGSLEIDGVAGVELPGSRSPEGSGVRSIVTLSGAAELTDVTETFTVKLRVRVSDASVFVAGPTNVANLSIHAGYSTV